jgi:hypothetical protein
MVMVVTQLNPGGSRCRYWRATSARKARRPELRSGMGFSARNEASRRISHLAGTRKNFTVPCSDVRAPTTWSHPSSSLTSWGISSFG